MPHCEQVKRSVTVLHLPATPPIHAPRSAGMREWGYKFREWLGGRAGGMKATRGSCCDDVIVVSEKRVGALARMREEVAPVR